MSHSNIAPFVKWAGGKRQLLSQIKERMPKEYNHYYEPFVGGGAVIFELLPANALINDINKALINTYRQICNTPEVFLKIINKLDTDMWEDGKDYYYSVREYYNHKMTQSEYDVELAALFVFINKHCFNGLYRVNNKGLFNVPYNNSRRVSVNEKAIMNISEYLKTITIMEGDFEAACTGAKKGDFVFMDSPYAPLNPTSFEAYTKEGFDIESHKRVARLYDKLTARGCYCMLTNHNTKLINELYGNKGYKIDTINVKRMINSDASNRVGEEVIICNYYGDRNFEKQKIILVSRDSREKLPENGNRKKEIHNIKKEKEISNIETRIVRERKTRRKQQMIKRDFDKWLNKFRPSISSYDYYIDFGKVVRNVEEIKVELNILNSLIGSKTIEEDFERIIERYPETLACIPLLLAVRGYEIYAQDEEGTFLYHFKQMNYEIEQYKLFMRKTGLFDMLSNHLVNNLVDYALGIETGLDSNGRKNRGGHQMEDLVEKYIVAAGFEKDINYFKEMYLKEVEQKWNIDLSALSNQGKAAKRFDFVIKTDRMIYGIEANFYGSGGSKLNETARSYKMLSQEADMIDGFTFVWFTDGIGWKSARGNLRETFEVMETIYSIDDMENYVMEKLFI